jgi:UDP-N-acetyl-D-mannosaminuronic acid dehydrogenase
MMAQNFGLSYETIRKGLSEDYPRAADLPKSGFAAGPCLLKDTLQLAAFNNNDFALGMASVTINEGLPLYLTHRLEQRYSIADKTVGILGMAFKGESDDIRSSLAYKLRRILRYKAAEVLAADPFVKGDNTLASEEEVISKSDIIVIGAPHKRYLDLRTSKPVIDVWALLGEESGL